MPESVPAATPARPVTLKHRTLRAHVASHGQLHAPRPQLLPLILSSAAGTLPGSAAAAAAAYSAFVLSDGTSCRAPTPSATAASPHCRAQLRFPSSSCRRRSPRPNGNMRLDAAAAAQPSCGLPCTSGRGRPSATHASSMALCRLLFRIALRQQAQHAAYAGVRRAFWCGRHPGCWPSTQPQGTGASVPSGLPKRCSTAWVP